MITKKVNIFYITVVPTSAIGKESDIAIHLNGDMYIKQGGQWIFKDKYPIQSHIADADGNLADITTKFNLLLDYLETIKLLSTS